MCDRSVLATADADAGLKQYSCCLLYQCVITDSRHYIQRLVHVDDGGPSLMYTVLDYLVYNDCEWGSVVAAYLPLCCIRVVCFNNEVRHQ